MELHLFKFNKNLTNLNLYSNSFDWKLFPNYFYLRLHRNANNANLEFQNKTRLNNIINKNKSLCQC